MNQTKPVSKPAGNPRRLYALLTVLAVLIVIGLTWGIRYYLTSSVELAIRDRRSIEASKQIDRLAWWGDSNGATSFMRSRIARLNGDLETAARLLTAAVRKGYEPDAIHVEQLMFLAQGGYVAPLLGESSLLIELGKVDAGELYFAAIRGYEFTGNLPEAKQLIDDWLKADSADPRVHFELGYYNELIDDDIQAKLSYQKALELAPYWSSPRIRTAGILLNEDAEAAANLYELAMVSEPDDPQSLLGCARAMTQTGRLDQASRMLDRYLELHSNTFVSRMVTAELLASEGKFSDSLAALASCIEQRPEDIRVNRLLERVYRELGDTVAADLATKQLDAGTAALTVFKEEKRNLIDGQTANFLLWLSAASKVFPYQAESAIYPLLVSMRLQSDYKETIRLLGESFAVSGDPLLAARYRKAVQEFTKKQKIDPPPEESP